MRDEDKSRQQLLDELLVLRQQTEDALQRDRESHAQLESAHAETLLANAARRASEAAIRETMVTLDLVFWVLDASGKKMIYVSPTYEKIWERPRQSLFDDVLSFLDMIHPEDRSRAEEAFQQHIRDGEVDCDFRLLFADGRIRWMWIRGRALRNDKGEILQHIGIGEDVTDQRDNEQAKFRLAAIIEASNDAILSSTLDGVIIAWNPGAERLYGYTANEIIGQNVSKLIPDEVLPVHRQTLERFKQNRAITNFETKRRRKDGTLIEVSLSIIPIAAKGSHPSTNSTIYRDLSRYKDLERRFQLAQRMEPIGVLAGGVAHDFNNVLTVVNGYCELLLKALSPEDKLRRMVEEMRSAGERASTLTRQLLAFSKQQALEPTLLDLNQLVADSTNMLQRMIGEDIVISLVLESEPKPIMADPGQIQQVLLNLAVNAKDAMPQGGTLTIETKSVCVEAGDSNSLTEVALQEFTLMSVSDNGSGMDDHTKEHIFEPFFTTKEVGKGTGLGLAMVFGIAQQSGGFVEVDSQVGQGATFRIYWPRGQAIRELQVVHPPVSAPSRSQHTLLLVEDDAAVRTLAISILESCGHRVLAAASGQEAIRQVEGFDGQIDLLVSDVVMPNLSGPKLAERLAVLVPNLKVLFMSGYSDATNRLRVDQHKHVDLIQKPFNFTTLSQKVSDALSRP